jgi:hypothetical protein
MITKKVITELEIKIIYSKSKESMLTDMYMILPNES